MSKPLSVLMVEDNADDVELIVHELRRGGYEPACTRVSTADEMKAAFDHQTWDVVISDHNLPQFDSDAAMGLMRTRGLDLPFIIVSGVMEEEEAIRAMRAGAHDYMAKGDLKRLLPAVEREVREARSRHERREAERALREAEEVFRALSACSSMGISMKDADGKLTYASPQYRSLLGLSLMECMGYGWQEAIHPDDRERCRESWGRFVSGGGSGQYMAECRLKSSRTGTMRWVQARAYPTRVGGGESTKYVCTLEDITEHKIAEEALRQSEERFRGVVESARDAIYTLSPDGTITSLNPAFETITGWSREEWLGKHFAPLVYPDDLPLAVEQMRQVLARVSVPLFELRIQHKAGHYIVGEFTKTPLVQGGKVIGVLGIARDVTERKQLEQQLRQAQKVEAVGRLAGGVAHDFNNILTAILGYSELMARQIRPGDPLRRHVDEIRKASERAAALTGQLLAFSRKQVLETKVFDVRQVVAGLDKMLRRLIGEDVQLVTEMDDRPINVKADPGQIEQVIMNLIVNARDAMPQGGKITIRLTTLTLNEELARHQENVPAGEYLQLAISDTGTGMSDEVKAHLFEPFFTTKPQGKGTGLGLATCYGIVKQSGGHILVESRLGEGTVFQIYLPRVTATATELPKRQEFGDLPKGKETVLLVEDEAAVRVLAEAVLSELGYQVIVASNGEEALRSAAAPGTKIDLLLTDVVMPQMGGRELSERLRAARPQLKVLYSSGYTDDVIIHHDVSGPGIAFLQKPYGPDTLANRVRRILDS